MAIAVKKSAVMPMPMSAFAGPLEMKNSTSSRPVA